MSIETSTAPLIDGTELGLNALVIAQNADSSYAIKRLPPTVAGMLRYWGKASGTLFTLADFKNASGILASNIAQQTVWILPAMFNLPYTYSDSGAPTMWMMNKGSGSTFVNPSICRSALGGGTQSQMLAGVGWSLGDTFIIATTIYTLANASAISTLSSWGSGVSCSSVGINPATYTGVTILDPKGVGINTCAQGQDATLAAIGPDLWTWL